ncbi:MAG: PIN domain-containing protein, partial [Planctomycetes bacterium]|nr:PIN domain-containing protein [Planctomycetota bacterium]
FPRARAVLESVAGQRDEGVISSHSVAEMYSALTSLPLLPRLLPAEAQRIIDVNIRPHFRVITLTRALYDRAVDACVRQSLSGGKVYDALLLECARKANCDRIYTFNTEDFRRLAPDLIDVIAAP